MDKFVLSEGQLNDPVIRAVLGPFAPVPVYSQALDNLYPPIIRNATAVRALIAVYAANKGDVRDEETTVAVLAPVLRDAMDRGIVANRYKRRSNMNLAMRLIREALYKPWVLELIPATV